MEESIKDLVETFFDKLSISLDSCQVRAEEVNIFLVEIKTENSGLIIGPHGKNLETIQFLLKLLVSKREEQNIILHLEVNDYLKNKHEKLISFIKTQIELVKTSGKNIELPFLTAYERKKVHSYVGELKSDIFTKSEGEGKERRMSICKTEDKEKIDINGDSI